MIKVTSFYKFFSIEKKALKSHQKKIISQAQKLNIRGLMLMGEEGLNATFCGKEKPLESFKKNLCHLFKEDFFWKDSYCEEWSFKRLSIKIKKEIINSGEFVLAIKAKEKNSKKGYLSPKQWEERLQKNIQILDVRNSYEVEIGKFKKAKALNIENFQEFPKKIEKSRLDKKKETLIYCTGGIRCEKAIEIMKDKGFKKIYQLEGGILNYLKEYPNSQFQKECFVFDRRVALDQKLQASGKYSLCPHCGQPARLKIVCKHCGKASVICKLCKDEAFYYETCSKNCAYHFRFGHKCHKKYKAKKNNKSLS